MDKLISLETTLSVNGVHFSGEHHFTFVNGKKYSFVKGYLGILPARFQHPLYNVKRDQTGCYLIREIQEGKTYAGSSEKIYKRISRHKEWLLGLKAHPNKVFNEIVKDRNPLDFELIIFFTNTREEAYELEQFFVNMYKETNQLINIAHDVRYAMRGHQFSEEHKNKISEANKGREVDEKARLNISLARKLSQKASLQMTSLHAEKRRRVSVRGVVYESITVACKALAMSETALRKATRDPKSDICFIDDVKSPLAGRSLSEEQRAKLSSLRKNNEAAQQQLASIRHLTQKKIVLNAVLYESITQAARETGIGESTIRRQLRENNFPKDEHGRYVVDYKYPRKKPVLNYNFKEENHEQHSFRMHGFSRC